MAATPRFFPCDKTPPSLRTLGTLERRPCGGWSSTNVATLRQAQGERVEQKHGYPTPQHHDRDRSARGPQPARVALPRPRILRGGEGRLPPRFPADRLPRKRDRGARRMAEPRLSRR